VPGAAPTGFRILEAEARPQEENGALAGEDEDPGRSLHNLSFYLFLSLETELRASRPTIPIQLPPSSNRLEGTGAGLETWLVILLVHLRQREPLPRSPLLHKALTGAKMCHGADEKENLSQNSIGTANRRSPTGRCREAAAIWLRCRRDRSHGGFACQESAAQPAPVRSRVIYRSAAQYRGVPSRESSRKGRSPEPRRLQAFCSSCEKGYSAAPSTALVCATVQSGAPTLKRAKRRTVRFSPSLPTFCAISSLMLMAWSLMNGCSRRQTSS
jgi:hypothetical protein